MAPSRPIFRTGRSLPWPREWQAVQLNWRTRRWKVSTGAAATTGCEATDVRNARSPDRSVTESR